MVAGDLSGLYGMSDFTYNEGKAKGMRAVRMDNGLGLSATLLADRCLDIPYFSYKGTNLGLVLKTGLVGPQYFAEDGSRGFLKQFNGGLLTTCGLQTAGAACELDGRAYGLHGQIHSIPGTSVNKEELTGGDRGDEIVLQVSADMREACVFGEYVELRRKVRMETERSILHMIDTVENHGFEAAPLVNLYHINFGYPFIDDGARLYFSAEDVEPRDETARRAFDKYHVAERAEIGRPEECYIHTGGGGAQFGMIHNERLGLAVIVHYDAGELPIFCEWKCMMAGDYAIGLEPSVAGFWGIRGAKERGLLKFLAPGEARGFHMRVEVTGDPAAIGAYAARCKESKL
jgi:hypothetical protein